MCRLFAMHAGADPVTATFWLLDAPDSLRQQSHREPDGAGIGVFGVDGRPIMDKQPIAAWQDAEFARTATRARSRTFVPAPLEVSTRRIRTYSDELAAQPAVIIASEPMDGESGWRFMDPGELVHIGTDLAVAITHPLPHAPRHQLTLSDMSPVAAASQSPAAQQTS